MQDQPVTGLPVGFETFHRRTFLNYQLNRAHALGYADRTELGVAAGRIRRLSDAPAVFTELSGRAEAQGRLRHAAGYVRIAAFFTAPASPLKTDLYRRYRDLFDRATAGTGITRHEVRYGRGHLPAYRVAGAGSGEGARVVLLHGGFDSFVEEFLALWERLAAAGFDVIAFDGPGQGGARALGGLTFDHDWEKPVAAILDRFEIESATIVGISMGGYWALRAAAYEPRIERVVAWPPVYGWLHRLPAAVRPAARVMLRRRRFMTWSIRARARLVPTLRHVVDHVLYLVDGTEPVDVVDWFLAMNPSHLSSERISQDVLLMVGEHDSFQPPRLAAAQAAALTAASSVTTRTFTAAEQADQHCQMGNLDLACAEVIAWLRRSGC